VRLLITDNAMPVMDGREDHRGAPTLQPGLPVIYTSEGGVEKTKADGVEQTIRVGRIVSAIQQQLSGSKACVALSRLGFCHLFVTFAAHGNHSKFSCLIVDDDAAFATMAAQVVREEGGVVSSREKSGGSPERITRIVRSIWCCWTIICPMARATTFSIISRGAIPTRPS
jgi:CheY-like chemotaxis protein